MKRLLAIGLLVVAACAPNPDEKPKPPPCPPPPEPDHQLVVVGTIGKLHLVESRYPLTKLAETMAVFKPDLVLIGARVDAFREDKLEDASFEMTYVRWLAKTRGVASEPIDWFRFEDLDAKPTPVDPADETSIEARETDILRLPKLYTFEQANSLDLNEKVLLAHGSAMRHRSGDPLASRRRAWIQHLAADAVIRHGRPKKVLAFVDVFDRPAVDAVVSELGYSSRSAADVLAKSKESLAGGDLPIDVVTEWRAEAERAHTKAGAFWLERAKVLDVAIEKKGGCCVTQSALTAPDR